MVDHRHRDPSRLRLRDHITARPFLSPSFRSLDWVIYAKPPFGGPRHVLEYLGRYTHRVPISNQRLLAADGHHVTSQWSRQLLLQPKDFQEIYEALTARSLSRCPRCGSVSMARVQTLTACRWPARPPDSS